jgi:hypothetical protein
LTRASADRDPGAGFGGLELSSALSEALGPDAGVTLIYKADFVRTSSARAWDAPQLQPISEARSPSSTAHARRR